MGTFGGRQPGAGRPISQATLKAQKFRERLVERVLAEAEPIIDALLTKAKAGDVQAMKEVIDRTLGKSKELVEHSGQVSFVIKEDGEPNDQPLDPPPQPEVDSQRQDKV